MTKAEPQWAGVLVIINNDSPCFLGSEVPPLGVVAAIGIVTKQVILFQHL